MNGASNAGEHSVKARIAFLIAKYAPMPYISGGSPTAFELKTARFSRVGFERKDSDLFRDGINVGNFVGRKCIRTQLAFSVVHDLFHRHPSDALNDAAFDLAVVDAVFIDEPKSWQHFT